MINFLLPRAGSTSSLLNQFFTPQTRSLMDISFFLCNIWLCAWLNYFHSLPLAQPLASDEKNSLKIHQKLLLSERVKRKHERERTTSTSENFLSVCGKILSAFSRIFTLFGVSRVTYFPQHSFDNIILGFSHKKKKNIETRNI